MDHTQHCPMANLGHSDAARRVSDTYNLHRIGGGYSAIRKWFAARLTDGTSDDVLYDTKQDATRHQKHNEQFYTFIMIGPASMTACDAEIMLRVSRTAYENGLRLADPTDGHGGKDLIKRSTVEDQLSLARGIASNLILPERLN